jgi:hypothetical protein
MQLIALQAVPNQTFITPVGSQNCRLNVYQKNTGLFIDVLLDEEPIALSRICQNLNRIVRDLYLGFAGDFMFLDTEGSEDPVYTGLGSRYVLMYIEASELPAGEG